MRMQALLYIENKVARHAFLEKVFVGHILSSGNEMNNMTAKLIQDGSEGS